ncbi:MAG: glycoside hydrolase family 38 C-terminal domain-containing protein [Candidatus Saccharicenans sp.]
MTRIKRLMSKKSISLFFIFTFLATFLFFGSLPSRAQSRPDLSKEKILFTVGYAHLDTQWRWDYQKTIKEYIWNTMADNFGLFEKYPDYIFNFSGANRYRMMAEYYPREYEKVKEYVAKGRWFPAGSSMEENDVMSPSFESIIRQILYGTNYFRKEFGFSSKEYILPDCFGFPASLPTILSHCGLKGFSTQKLSWGSAVGIPFNIGVWIGPDGQSVIAALNPGDYSGRITGDLTQNETWIRRVMENGQKYGVYADYMYYGTGDVGGAPDDYSVRNLEKSIDSSKKSEIKVVSSRAEDLFLDITAEQKQKLPSYRGEFLLTNHSAGSITSEAAMKRWNRKNEFLGYKSEAAAVMADWLGGIKYNQDKINEAWRLVLGAQFHDILPGTSIPRAYEFSWNDEVLAANQFGQVLNEAAGAVCQALDTKVSGVPVVVYNSLNFEREDIAEAKIEFPQVVKNCRVFDSTGVEVPSQVIQVDGKKVKIIFLAKVPSLGFSAFDVRPSAEPCRLNTGLKVSGSSLENNRYLVKINREGDVSSIFDLKEKRELLASPIRLSFQHEKPQQWPAWNMDWEDRMKPPVGYVEAPAKITILENGPARVALKIERESRHSKFVQIVRLAAGAAEDRLEFQNYIDWATPESSLKAAFPLTVSNPLATYNWGVGTIQRGNNDPKKFEVPSHLWFDLTDKSGAYGVSVLEDCKYGSDKPSDNIIRLTLLYTPGVRTWPKEQAYQDFGKHEVLFALYGHKNDWRAGNTNQQALRLNQPLISFQTVPHSGSLGKSFSFVKVSPDNLEISALKKAENSDEIIVRLVETKGQEIKKATLSFPGMIMAAREVNGVEDEVGPAQVKNGQLIFNMNPYSLKTFALKLAPPKSQVLKPVSVVVDLPYNVDVFSYDGHQSDGSFDSEGRSYPAELLRDSLTVDSLNFKLGPTTDGAKNAVACEGQTIKLPEGKFNRLYILAAASEENQKGIFKVGDKQIEIPVAFWSGFIGQWDDRLWAEGPAAKIDFDGEPFTYIGVAPGYTKQDEVAFFTTHIHNRTEGNEPYVYGYMFKYVLDLPAEAKEIILPNNPAIKILAMTVAQNENDNTRAAVNLFDVLKREAKDYERFAVVPAPVIAPSTAHVSPEKPATVVIQDSLEGAEIHYTLDGSEPNEKSPVYTEPLVISTTTVIKAIAYHPVRLKSPVTTAFFSQSYPIKDIIYFNPPAPERTGAKEEKTLIDLVRATPEIGDPAWQGFEKNNLEVVLDLGEKKNVYDLTLGCLENNNNRVFLPVAVKIEVSTDGKNFETIVDETRPRPEKPQSPGIRTLSYSLKGREARYIRVTAVNIRTVPVGFRYAGQNAWMMFDEIYVR